MGRVAVLLNRHAQGVSRDLVAWMRGAVRTPADVFETGSVEEGREVASAIVASGYNAVCVGGGDGTFAQFAGDLTAFEDALRPALLPLRLGGGNAIHDVCGSSPPTASGLLADYRRAESERATARLRLLEVDGVVTHFAGVGVDSGHIEDYDALIKQRLRQGPLAPLARGVPAIALTVLARTLPRLLTEPPLRARLVNEGAPARRLDARGRPVGGAIETGATLYEGEITIAAAATITQYSRGITFFPFADSLAEGFQLRVSRARAWEVLRHLPGVLSGRYFNPETILDFEATRVRVELDAPTPFHVSGDLRQGRSAFTLALSPHTVRVLRR